MFQSSAQTIMSLDSRVCQLDVKGCMVVVSTLTRCYVCDTSQEQYRQIGQKLRDGEFGACFFSKENCQENENVTKDFTEVKAYNIVDDNTMFAAGSELQNTLIYCSRPSSRLWEATIEGTVQRTHQFKQVLAKSPLKVVSQEDYDRDKVQIVPLNCNEEGKSVNFSKVYRFNDAIFSFQKNALYFLDVLNNDNTVWTDAYLDIVECKIYHDNLYLWLSNRSLVHLRFMKIDKFLVQCFIEEKYVSCTELCTFYSDYLLTNDLSTKLHILVGLREKIEDKDVLKSIEKVLENFQQLHLSEATKMKSGIYVLDNAYQAQTSLADGDRLKSDDNKYGSLPPEALQTLKDISLTVSDKLNSSKKILKEKWEDFEEKMKHRNEKQNSNEFAFNTDLHEATNQQIVEHVEQISDTQTEDFIEEVIYKESSQKAIEVDSSSKEEDDVKVCRSLYKYFRINLVSETDESNLVSIIENYSCDISEIYNLMLLLEKYCITIGALEESKYLQHNIFLSYLNISSQKDSLLDAIINNEVLYKYFVDSCISVNMKMQKSNLGCECGFPLPYIQTNDTPAFAELIDEFIEKQWSSQTRDQCYDMCKRMPYLWKKILYLRRNEDLINILRILLQMLDETLLHTFLPQFTLDIWDKAIQLYAILQGNICLNCNRKFDHISVKETLSWDDIGAIIIKSVGSRNAVKIMEKHANLIGIGELTMKFYHTCLLVAMYERYDAAITCSMTDALYSSYMYAEARSEICKLLRSTTNGQIKNTALPLIVAASSTHWGLQVQANGIPDHQTGDVSDSNDNLRIILDSLSVSGITDCPLCGLPLRNNVLIQDGGIWVFKCGHVFHGACLNLNKIKLCPSC